MKPFHVCHGTGVVMIILWCHTDSGRGGRQATQVENPAHGGAPPHPPSHTHKVEHWGAYFATEHHRIGSDGSNNHKGEITSTAGVGTCAFLHLLVQRALNVDPRPAAEPLRLEAGVQKRRRASERCGSIYI